MDEVFSADGQRRKRLLCRKLKEENMKPIVKCSNCHQFIQEDEESCSSCGSKYYYIDDESYESNTDEDKTETKGGKMKCRKCYQDILENEEFCSSCGVGVNVYNSSDNSGGFLELVRRIYRNAMSFLLIVIIIVFTIIGSVSGILGALIGFIVGSLFVVLVGGSIATFIEIGENIRAIRKELTEIKNENKQG